jgi:hypothetical protein
MLTPISNGESFWALNFAIAWPSGNCYRKHHKELIASRPAAVHLQHSVAARRPSLP